MIELGSDRAFGLIVGGILTAIGIYQYVFAISLAMWFGAPGITLMFIGLVAPRFLHPLNVAWARLGILLGRVITPVVMFVVYVVSVVPIGLILRLFGKDLLGLKRKEGGASYWVQRQPPGPTPESLKDQF